ncbi:fatty acid desaturase [Gelidibacter salicanalis]|uniref:Fatty acid desaturase n=2 Tax=Gelidibacter salicanalis TaxID=291193 RepID=A0A5C7ANJ6_9FLAO|nr:fatty acid desaturase [Gelidibacter salicanalis]
MYLLLFTINGLVSVLIFVNCIHEASHHNIFSSKWANNALLTLFDFIGIDSYIWKKRHILLHHNFQNVSGWDSDIEQSGFIKIYPHDKSEWYHNYQHKFVFMLYPLFLFNWIFVRDFKDFFSKKRIIKKVLKHIPILQYIKLFFFKLFFIFYTIILPIWIGFSLKTVLTGFCLMLVAGSVFSMGILLTSHVNQHNQFPLPDANGNLNLSWLEHQFVTTNDINTTNWFTRNVMGNFNFHLVHHLFPNINSAYVPEITKIVQDYALKNGFSYRSYTMRQAFKHHYQLIKSNALNSDVFEEDM